MRKALALCVLVLVLSLGLLLLCGCGDDGDTAAVDSSIVTEKSETDESITGDETVSYDIEGLTISGIVPQGWYSEQRTSGSVYFYDVPSQDQVYSNTPRISVEILSRPEMLVSVRTAEDIENLADIPNRTIAGIDMVGKTYTVWGMDWFEYYALVNDTPIMVHISRIDIESGVGRSVLESIAIE